jgi:hypothetical protein
MARAGDIEPRRGWGDIFGRLGILILCGALCGCLPSTGSGPERLYSVHDELTSIRQQVGQVQFGDYYKLSEPKRVDYRNEFIAARMYAIDVAFGAFDAALTQERQKTGFAATAANLGLTTASTLFSPPGTKSMLSAASTAVTGVKAAYNDDILLAHAVELMQGQMRTNRATISTQILKGMQLSTTAYPLAAAMSDLEAYYQAGTITGALLKLNESVGTAARNAEITRSDVILTTRFTETDATTTLNNFLFTSGPKAAVNAANRQKLIDLIVAEGNTPNKAAALLGSALGGGQPDLARRLAAAVTHGL